MTPHFVLSWTVLFLGLAAGVGHAQPPRELPVDEQIEPMGAVHLHARAPRTGRALGLDEVLASVEEHFPLIRAALLDVRAAEAEMLAADGAFDPILRAQGGTVPYGEYPHWRLDTVVEQPTPLWGTSFLGGYRMGTGPLAPYDGKRETNQLGELRAGFSVPLARNGWTDRRRANLERASLGRRISQLGVTQARLETVRAATVRYWAWVAAGARLRVAQDLLDLALERERALHVRLARGDVADIEVTENLRAILQRRAALVAAQRGLEQAAIDLSLYLRDPMGQPRLALAAALPDRLPEPRASEAQQKDNDLQAALAARPDAARLAAVQQQQRVDLDLAHNQLLPQVDVTVMGSQDFGYGKPGRARPELEAFVTVEVPLPGRTGLGRVDAAQAALRRTQEQLRFQKDRIVAEVRDALSAMEAARQRVALARQEVTVAQRLEGLERHRFDLGDSTLLIVNLRETATAEAALREVDAMLEYQRFLAEYLAATAAVARR